MENSAEEGNKLIQEIQQGNQEIIGEVYRKYREPFLTWCQSAYKLDDAQSADIFQNAVIAFYRNVAQGKLKALSSTVKTYLFAIGKNLILKEFRDRKPTTDIDDFILKEPLSELDVYKEYSQTEESETIAKALEILGEPCNQIIMMFYYRGYAMEIIKNRLGYKTESVARTQKKRCMQYLKKLIKEKFSNDLR